MQITDINNKIKKNGGGGNYMLIAWSYNHEPTISVKKVKWRDASCVTLTLSTWSSCVK